MKPACGFEDFSKAFEPDPGTQGKVATPGRMFPGLARAVKGSVQVSSETASQIISTLRWDMCHWDAKHCCRVLLRAQACPEPTVLPSVGQIPGLQTVGHTPVPG